MDYDGLELKFLFSDRLTIRTKKTLTSSYLRHERISIMYVPGLRCGSVV